MASGHGQPSAVPPRWGGGDSFRRGLCPAQAVSRHPQQILDRDTIGNATRGRELMPLDRIVDMAVSRLRQRLRDTGKSPRLIRTVRGSGYLLAAHVMPQSRNGY